MKTWQKWLVKRLKLKGTLDTEQILREKNRRIIELEHQLAELKSRLWHPSMVHVEIDPIMKKQAQAQIGTYEPPERHMDPAQGMRLRATMRQLQEQPGTLMQHHKEMQQKKALTKKLDPPTEQLPNVRPYNLSFTRLEPMHSVDWML